MHAKQSTWSGKVSQHRNHKVFIIGLDGATWDLIRPWAKEVQLPTFRKMIDEGAWGVLESVMRARI